MAFLKCQDTCFSPRSSDNVEEIWGQLVDDGINLLVCPGNHYSMSESPNAIVTGSILATALAFKYRLVFPEFPRPTRTFSQRRAVEKLSGGVVVFLHSKKGNQILVQCQYNIAQYNMLFKWTREIGVYASEFRACRYLVPRVLSYVSHAARSGTRSSVSAFWRRNSTEKSLTRLKEFIVSPFDEHL